MTTQHDDYRVCPTVYVTTPLTCLPAPTMQDVIDLGKFVSERLDLFGAPADWVCSYRRRYKAIGSDLCEELHVTQAQAINLSLNILLPPKAEKSFHDLRRWLQESLVVCTSNLASID